MNLQAISFKSDAKYWKNRAQLFDKGGDNRRPMVNNFPAEPSNCDLRLLNNAAWSARLRIRTCGSVDFSTGFFISSDGFFLAPAQSAKKAIEVRDQCYSEFECEHVADIQGCHLSLFKAKRVIKASFLCPEPVIEDGQVSIMGVQQGAEEKRPVTSLGRVAVFEEELVFLGEVDTWPYANYGKVGNALPGEPVLSMNPGHFVGVTLYDGKDKTVSFCPVTLGSTLWMNIEQAMATARLN